MSHILVKIEPIDPLLFKDNRMARAGDDHILSSKMPSPYTIFGAIGNHIIKLLEVNHLTKENWDEKIKPYMGDFITTDSNEFETSDEIFQLLGYTLLDVQGNNWFPAPKHLLVEKKNKYPLGYFKIEKANGISSNQFPKLLVKTTDREIIEQEYYIDESSMEEIITGKFPSNLKIKFKNDFILEEYRSGLGMDNQRNVTRKSILFNRPYWRFASRLYGVPYQWHSSGFLAWFNTKKENELQKRLRSSIGIIGGDRGRAIFHFSSKSDTPLNSLLEKVIDASPSSKGLWVYLLTPLPVKKEINQYTLNGKNFDAAAIGKPVYVSGWLKSSHGQHPRGLLHLAPAGSVFFYEWKNESKKEKEQIIRKFWLDSLTPEYKIFGFGRILIGVWK